MHIPPYARATIRAALPTVFTTRQLDGEDCCLCERPFEGRRVVLLGPTPESGPFGCGDCLTRLVAKARQDRDAALALDADQARAESSAWEPVRERHLARLDRVGEAAEAVTRLARGGETPALRVAWLLISLESAYHWLPEAPEPPVSMDRDRELPRLKDAAFRLDLAMISAREAVAERLAYHVINEAQPDEPEMCEEFECPDDCSGRHDVSEIDCGPDAVFDDLAEHGVTVEKPEPEPLGPALRALLSQARGEEGDRDGHAREPAGGRGRFADLVDNSAAVLEHFKIAADDPEVLLSAAAVGLVADAWREGPLDEIHAAEDGPSDGDIIVQSVDLYHRAKAALLAARDDGPEALSAFVAVASDVRLRWAGDSRFVLRQVSGSTAEFLTEFVRHVDDRVWFTAEVMRAQGWRAALLHRAASAAFKASAHFGMPTWPSVVARVTARLAEERRTDVPDVLADLESVERTLSEAPERLGVAALDWLARQGLLDPLEAVS